MRPTFRQMVDEEGIIDSETCKQLWLDHLRHRQQILWDGVGYGFPSLLQMFFAEIDNGVTILCSDAPINVTVLRCGKQKWAWYRVDGENVLHLVIDHCNCSTSCEWYGECGERNLSEVTIP